MFWVCGILLEFCIHISLQNIANNARKSMASPKMFQFSLVPNITKLSDVNSQGAIHFLCGKSQVEGGAIKEAIHQFGRVLELLPNHAKASPSTMFTRLELYI